MILQLSSGQGPVECELAVYKLYCSLKKEFPDIVVTSTSERTQLLNRKDALNKLNILLNNHEHQAKAKQKGEVWIEHYRIVRGNPVRVYKGKDFKLI